jgi:hypothetical protein
MAELPRLEPRADSHVQHQMSSDEERVQAPSFVGEGKYVFQTW